MRGPSLNLDDMTVDPAVIELLAAEIAAEHRVIPVDYVEPLQVLIVAAPPDAFDRIAELMGRLETLTGLRIEPIRTEDDQLDRALARYYGAAI